ncbi:hypothetical protein JCM3770_006863 [Rhodotorula araucariae]
MQRVGRQVVDRDLDPQKWPILKAICLTSKRWLPVGRNFLYCSVDFDGGIISGDRHNARASFRAALKTLERLSFAIEPNPMHASHLGLYLGKTFKLAQVVGPIPPSLEWLDLYAAAEAF